MQSITPDESENGSDLMQEESDEVNLEDDGNDVEIQYLEDS